VSFYTLTFKRSQETVSKKWVWVTFGFIFLFSCLVILFNFIVDPLHYYRLSQENILWTEQRWQLPGLAKNYQYNTIILGTSMTENFVPKEVNNKFHGAKTLKLSMSGSSTYEQNKIAQLAFENNKIDYVIWGIDYTSLSKEEFKNEDFPTFLYDDNRLNDLKYLLNVTTAKYSLITLLYYISPQLANISSPILNFNDEPQLDLNSLYYWGDQYTYNKEIVIDNFIQNKGKENKEDLLEIYNFNRMKSNIDENILEYVKEHPETSFYFYYPPYSILKNEYLYGVDPLIIENIIKTREYFYKKLSKYQNAKLFDFTTDKKITFNLDNYKDTMHHSPEINEYILDSFNHNKYLITDKNVKTFLHDYKTQIKEFNLNQIH
jgi:hypothetical protein